MMVKLRIPFLEVEVRSDQRTGADPHAGGDGDQVSCERAQESAR